MTSILRPAEVGGDRWVHESTAFKLKGSAGDNKLRIDVLDLFGGGLPEEEKLKADVGNQFRIALNSDKIEERADGDKPLVSWTWGEVAVKVGKSDSNQDRYAYFNINSLVNRLGLTKDVIKRAEKDGNVDELIRAQVYKLVMSDQKRLATTLNNIKNFITTQDVAAGDILSFEDDEKVLVEKYVNAVDDSDLKSKFDAVLGGKAIVLRENEEDYATQLAHKLWFETIPGAKLEKRAIKPEGNIYWGEAQKREENPKGEAKMRFNPLKNDAAGRYAFGIGHDFYTEKPEPKSNKEVPVKLEQGWVLANVESLKGRLGFASEKEVRDLADNGTLNKEIEDRSAIFRKVSQLYNDLDELSREGEITQDDVPTILKEIESFTDYFIDKYPDKEVSIILKEYIPKIKFEPNIEVIKSNIEEFITRLPESVASKKQVKIEEQVEKPKAPTLPPRGKRREL